MTHNEAVLPAKMMARVTGVSCIDFQAALDLMIGHLNVERPMWFGFSPKVPSESALRLMKFAEGIVVRDAWREALNHAKVMEAARLIAGHQMLSVPTVA